jgi:hypothetical protein
VREHRRVVSAASILLTISAGVTASLATLATDHLRAALAASCAAIAALLGVAAWLVLVEPDEGGERDESLEPNWWPDFERDLTDWLEQTRMPVAGRR